ncbi:MAG TPA: TetR/AcrR family transcriptional regulator [Actinomycetes bacterium]
MTDRGDATRAKLIAATTQVVREVGYAHATTKAIAAAAGVSEGTIYRHYPDKTALFFAAVLDRNIAIVKELGRLPERAGQRTVETNLTDTLGHLAGLRDDILPLELALLTDPEMAEYRNARLAAPGGDGPPTPIAAYLQAEQDRGRIRTDLDCDQAAVVLLATLFGLSLATHADETGINKPLLRAAVHTFVEGAGT